MSNIQLGFLVNMQKCVGCGACQTACEQKHKAESNRQVLSVASSRLEWEFLSMSCNHCANPECMLVCPNGCYRKLRNGIVLHSYFKCISCGRCVGACPFKAPRKKKSGKVTKCDLCYDNIQAGKSPECVAACVTGALQVIDVNRELPTYVVKTTSPYPIVQFTNPSIRFVLPKSPECFWRTSGGKGEKDHE